MRRWFRGAIGCSLVGLMVGGGGTALAAGPGVHIDPDSPAGKEYAIPLDTARRAAEGTQSGAGDAAPLFGAGISGRNGGDSGGGGAAGDVNDEASDRGASAGGDAGRDRGASAGDARAATRAVSDGGDGPSADLLALLIALGVLAVGGLIGLSVRAVRGAHPTG